jgi:hypothetical protein
MPNPEAINPADLEGPEQGTAEYKKLKEEMNEGADHVYVGTKKEVEAARLKVESEGRAPDLASFIRINKSIPISAEVMAERAQPRSDTGYKWYERFMNNVEPGEAEIYTGGGNGAFVCIYFKDSDGNLAKVLFSPENIDENEGLKTREDVADALRDLGFNPYSPGVAGMFGEGLHPSRVIEDYQQALDAQVADEKKQAFNF